jgi:hypothetical protein
MKRALLVIVLAACNDPGLLLEVHASSGATMTTVEVMIPDGVRMNGMGMPPMQSPKTQGTVYEVIETTAADVSDGSAKVLLQAGSIDAVPALLVLGHDASGAVNGYAVITDPSSSDGLIHFRHTASDEIVVHLDPIAQMPVAQARMPAQTDRLARWSTGGDDPAGKCVGIIHADGKGDFFGPQGDKDCDAANPECDDTWFLRSTGAGKCATQTPPANDDTMDACRIGATLGCTDNVTSDGACNVPTPGLCTPVTVCDHCTDLINATCIKDAVNDNKTAFVECTVFYSTESGGAASLCPSNATTPTNVDLTPYVGLGWGCVGPSGWADFSVGPQLMPGIPLASTTDTLMFTCHQLGLDFSIEGQGTAIDPQLMPTTGTVYFGVNDLATNTTTPAHFLALPFVATYQQTVQCPPDTMVCQIVDGDDNGSPFFDPMWHCAGN